MGARLGPYNLALVACYAAPTWGAEAVKALTSPYGGLIDPVHAAAAVRLRVLLNLPPERLLDVASWLAAFKLVVVAALLAYMIEFARAVMSDRAPDRATTDTVLALAVMAVAIWIMQALVFDPTAVTQAHVAQLLMVAGALIVSTIERHIEDMAAAASLPDPMPLKELQHCIAEGRCSPSRHKTRMLPVGRYAAADLERDV